MWTSPLHKTLTMSLENNQLRRLSINGKLEKASQISNGIHHTTLRSRYNVGVRTLKQINKGAAKIKKNLQQGNSRTQLSLVQEQKYLVLDDKVQ